MSGDDDLRFGDVSGGDGGGGSNLPEPAEYILQAIIVLVFIYIGLAMIEIMFDVNIPFV